jgi:hypothetical protein
VIGPWHGDLWYIDSVGGAWEIEILTQSFDVVSHLGYREGRLN